MTRIAGQAANDWMRRPATRIHVRAAPGRARLQLTDGPIGVRVLHADADGARVGLVATTALLLGGDHIDVDVRVGPGAWLEIVETAGTVAYDAGGVASSWTVRMEVADGGVLIWAGEPFVVAAGANVDRRSTVRLGHRAVACLRDTVVLGRSGEVGGSVTSTLSARCGEALLLQESLDLTEPVTRGLPGVVGTATVLDTVSLLGMRAPATAQPAPGLRFELDGPGTLARALTAGYADSPLASVWTAWRAAAAGSRRPIDETAVGPDGDPTPQAAANGSGPARPQVLPATML